MTTDPPTAPESGRWQFSLRTLVIVHVVASLVGCAIVSIDSPPYVFAILVVSSLFWGQTCLLGIWLALGTNAGRCRVAGTCAGTAYLATITAYQIWSMNIGSVSLNRMLTFVLPMNTLPTLGVAAALLVVRGWKAHLVDHGSEFPVSAIEGLQFSIRHLFYLTTAVAVLLVMARGVGALGNFLGFPVVIVSGMMSLPFISVTLAAVWACLCVGRPTGRILVVLLLAVFGDALLRYVKYVGAPNVVAYNWRMPTLTVLSAVVVTASLLVVRSNGYRLVRRSPRVTPRQNDPEITIQ